MQKENELQGITTLPSLADLPSPKTTSVSIITPPKVGDLKFSDLFGYALSKQNVP